MQEELDVKIFISGHKPCFEVKNEIFVPARQKEIIAALEQGTEEDRFMAARANEYCELLTQYWAWKYVQADYYGFGHYRRYFDFSDEKLRSRRPALQEKYLHARTAAAHGLYDVARIRRMLSRCDVLASVPFNYYIKSGASASFATSAPLYFTIFHPKRQSLLPSFAEQFFQCVATAGSPREQFTEYPSKDDVSPFLHAAAGLFSLQEQPFGKRRLPGDAPKNLRMRRPYVLPGLFSTRKNHRLQLSFPPPANRQTKAPEPA